MLCVNIERVHEYSIEKNQSQKHNLSLKTPVFCRHLRSIFTDCLSFPLLIIVRLFCFRRIRDNNCELERFVLSRKPLLYGSKVIIRI